MKNMLRKYFGFSKRQMNGFLLLALLSQILLAWTFYVHPVDNYTEADRQRDLVLLDSMQKEWQQQKFQKANYNHYPKKNKPSYPKSKSYGTSKYPKKKKYSKKNIQPFDIATADTSQLKQIRGIGSKLSARIIAFRNKLGGFYSIEQLRQVYGLTPEVQEKLLKYAFLGKPVIIKKLLINQAPEKALRKHPYISYKLAKVLVNYRKQHGNYQSKSDLDKIRMLDEEGLNKLLPYIDFEIP